MNNIPMFIKKQRGFTLVELMVVIAILGILAAIAIPRLMDSSEAAKRAKIMTDLRTIDSAVVLYYNANGNFPSIYNPCQDLVNAGYLATAPVPPTSIKYPDGTTHTVAKQSTSGYVLCSATAADKADVNRAIVQLDGHYYYDVDHLKSVLNW